MGLLVQVLQIPLPDYVKKIALRQLWQATAAAFGVEPPPLAGLDYAECLAGYAQFAQTHGEQWLREGRAVQPLEQRLYRNAVELGRRNGRWLRPGTLPEVMAVGRALYRILDIDLQGDTRGEIVVNRCYFSRLYSSDVCRLMSAMDRGLFAGLSNGGKLSFTSRITEGQPCCRAQFRWEGWK